MSPIPVTMAFPQSSLDAVSRCIEECETQTSAEFRLIIERSIPSKDLRRNITDADRAKELFGQYGKSNTDTGSPESQIALFSYRISHLTEHLKSNKHDFGTQRALLRLVGKRRALLEYLKEVDIERYRAIVKTLNLRK